MGRDPSDKKQPTMQNEMCICVKRNRKRKGPEEMRAFCARNRKKSNRKESSRRDQQERGWEVWQETNQRGPGNL